MISRSKIRQLEEKFSKTRKGEGFIVWHDITQDGRLLDDDGYVMNKEKVKLIEKIDQEAKEIGGKVFFEVSCAEPKIRGNSVITPYLQK